MAESGRIASMASSGDVYYPSLSVYNPQISVEQWQDILNDPELTPPCRAGYAQIYCSARQRGYLCAACTKWKILSVVL